MKTHEQSLDGAPIVLRNSAAMPQTDSAREHLALLIRTSQEVGQILIARACGHDKSWVCRVIQGDGRLNIAEMLAWLDAAGLRLAREDAQAQVDMDLLSVLLRKTAQSLDSRSAAIHGEEVTVEADEYRALMMLAKRGLASMQEARR
jgi:hypothetical protein